MTYKNLLLFCILLLCCTVAAQQDSVAVLPVIEIADTQLRDFSKTQSVFTLGDSVISKNQSALTSLINYNTVIYFKENGLGMVSSPSFRGTTAQQTAVIWNGININSQLNGQTDFNVLNTRDFNTISVRAGGGSVIYGSSAIGGSIHLNNELEFKNKFTNEARLSYGSFDTRGVHYRVAAAAKRFSATVSVTRNDSDNDYDYANGGENLNGQFYNTSISAVAGYKVNDNNTVKFYSYFFDGQRHFSLIFPSETRTKYRDNNTRNMLEWDGIYGKYTSKVKLAFLTEEYRYFADIERQDFSNGNVETAIARYDGTYRFTGAIKLNALIDYTQNSGTGSDIYYEKRQIGSGALLLSHTLNSTLQYEAGIRKEITSNYESPLLFSFGTSYSPASFYTLKLNTSKNFRVPTFNDLYWMDGGNADLNPESSWQAEVGNEITFNNFSLSLTGYYIKIKDMLRWLPAGNVWRPQNTSRVNTYGLETILGYKKTFGIHTLGINGTYAYTISKDEENSNQLIYVPYHKVTSSLSYNVKKISAYYQFLYNGEVFTRSDNNARYNLPAYTVGNIGVDYNFSRNNSCVLGVQVLNVWDKDYVSVDSRPLPGRNYMMYLTVKF